MKSPDHSTIPIPSAGTYLVIPMNDQLWIEPVGDLIIARLRGEPTEALLRTCPHGEAKA